MSTINERFKKMRKACEKTQEEWGAIIGITRAGIADIEAGRRNVTDKHLVALKNSIHNVNVDWIKTGNGEMFHKLTRNHEIQSFANDIMENIDDSFKKRFILALSKLSESDWETIEEIVNNLKEED